jgi:ribosomal protein L7/L12
MKSNLNDELQTLREEGKSQDEILYFLSLEGLSIIDAIVATRTLYGIKLEEAKKLVASSRHWEKAHMNSQVLHDTLEKIAEEYKSLGDPA